MDCPDWARLLQIKGSSPAASTWRTRHRCFSVPTHFQIATLFMPRGLCATVATGVSTSLRALVSCVFYSAWSNHATTGAEFTRPL